MFGEDENEESDKEDVDLGDLITSEVKDMLNDIEEE